jgi:hypothetical protein
MFKMALSLNRMSELKKTAAYLKSQWQLEKETGKKKVQHGRKKKNLYSATKYII